VKDYFLFDGEKIERLTRSGLEQRREIRNGVRNLLGVDALETAIEASDCAVKSFNKALSSDPRTTENMARLLNELGGAEIESEAVSRRVDELADEERLSRDEMSRIDEKLNKYEEIRHLLNKRIDNEQQIKALTQKASISMSSMSELVCRTAACIVRPTLEAVFNYIDERKRKGDIPAEIRRDLILRILEEGHCICGNRITECTPEYYNIKRWLERSDDSSLQDAALDLWRYLSAALDRMENDRAEAQKRIIEHSEVVSEAQRLVDENAQLQSQIGGSDRQDISELDSMRSRIRAKQVQIEAEARNCSSRLVELEGRIARLKARIEEERRTANLNTVFSGRYGLAVAVRDALKEVHESYTGEIKAIIGEKATEVFRALIDAEGRTALKRIVVDDDYSLEVLDRWDRSFLANVSAGQRQIMSIAFISALASCASGASTINMPLFMDTPFGRLSSAHRNNLIRHVPTIASQWILLATDTEFTRAEATELMRTGQWGTFYQLVATPEGNTVIEGQRVEDALAYLR
jgi:DNA sulfur modification protein DndD